MAYDIVIHYQLFRGPFDTMPSFSTVFLAVATAFVATVQADYRIEPSSVPLSTRSEYTCHTCNMFPSWSRSLILYHQSNGASLRLAHVRPSAETSRAQAPR